jgi:hypothetical protein
MAAIAGRGTGPLFLAGRDSSSDVSGVNYKPECREPWKEGAHMKRLMLAVVVAVIAVSAPASARIWLISPDGMGDAPTIKAGVDSAVSGDVLLLADGIYTGVGNTNISYYGKAITIKSASDNPFDCVIDCEGSGSNWRRGFLFYSNEGLGSVLEGVTVQNGYGYEGGGIWCWRASPTIINCIFSGNVATSAGGGFYCGGGSAPAIHNVTFYENGAPMGGSMYCIDESRPEVHNTIVAYTLYGAAVAVGDAYSLPDLYCCDLYGNADGDWTGSISNQLGINGNMCLDPLFCFEDNPAQPFTIATSSPCAGLNHPDCGLVGAGDIGCVGAAVVIEAVVDMHPRSLNVVSRGKYVTCFIELPEGFEPADIDVSTVKINDEVSAELTPADVGDYDTDGIPDLMVKFSRQALLDAIDETGDVEITISGQVDGQMFSGVATVRILAKREGKISRDDGPSGDMLTIAAPGPVTSASGATIEFNLPEADYTRLTIFDVRGRVVTTLVEQTNNAGTYSVTWDGHDKYGVKVSSGIYFASLETTNEVVTGKIMVVR